MPCWTKSLEGIGPDVTGEVADADDDHVWLGRVNGRGAQLCVYLRIFRTHEGLQGPGRIGTLGFDVSHCAARRAHISGRLGTIFAHPCDVCLG